MKNSTIVLITLVFSLFVIPQSLLAGEGHKHGNSSNHSAMDSDDSVKTMANIMMHLNHHPSSSDKKVLGKIAQNSQSKHERTIAQSMMNLQHKASSADKTKLKEIMNDTSATENVRALAQIVHDLSHQPSRNDKHKLQAMID